MFSFKTHAFTRMILQNMIRIREIFVLSVGVGSKSHSFLVKPKLCRSISMMSRLIWVWSVGHKTNHLLNQIPETRRGRNQKGAMTGSDNQKEAIITMNGTSILGLEIRFQTQNQERNYLFYFFQIEVFT